MSNINDTAVATEDTNVKTITEELIVENSITQTAPSTAETKVETELTAEQLAEQKVEANIVKQFGVKALVGRNSIKDIVNELENGKNQLTMNTLSLGYTLVTNNTKEFERIPDIELENWI